MAYSPGDGPIVYPSGSGRAQIKKCPDNPNHLVVFLLFKDIILSTCGALLISSPISMHLSNRSRPAGLESRQDAPERKFNRVSKVKVGMQNLQVCTCYAPIKRVLLLTTL